MSDVPSDILGEILVRLPHEPLLRFRSVCKAWRSIIDHPDFTKLQFRRNAGVDVLLIQIPFELDALPLGSLNSPQNRTIETTRIPHMVRGFVPRLLELPTPWCHDLILIPNFETRKKWVVWRPFTGEVVKYIPPYNSFQEGWQPNLSATLSSGIGYDSVNNDYKVVRIAKLRVKEERDYERKTLIYSLRKRTWRMIEDFPSVPGSIVASGGVFVNRALYWIATVKEGRKSVFCLVVLDLVTESYSKIGLPDKDFPKEPRVFMVLDALGGFLFASCLSTNGVLQRLFILQEYGEKGKWTNVIPSTNLKASNFYQRPIAYVKKKEQVLVQVNVNTFIWCDVEKKTWLRTVNIKGIERDSTIQVISASLDWVSGSKIPKTRGSERLAGRYKRKREESYNKSKLELSFYSNI